MFQSPENRGGEEMDLDFTKKGAIEGLEVQEDHTSIDDKIIELKNNIVSAEKGVGLAKKLGDAERTAQMEAKKMEFEETLAMLEEKPEEFKQEFWVEPEDDAFSRAVGRENGGALDKMDRRS